MVQNKGHRQNRLGVVTKTYQRSGADDTVFSKVDYVLLGQISKDMNMTSFTHIRFLVILRLYIHLRRIFLLPIALSD